MTISEPVLSAQTSSWSRAAALKVSPAAINTYIEVQTSDVNLLILYEGKPWLIQSYKYKASSTS
jgi:hypothetical protein